MEDAFQIVMYCLEGGLLLLVVVGLARKLFQKNSAKATEVPATVIDKRESTYTKYSNYSAPEQVTDYILVFQSGEETLSFTTSIWNYDAVEKGEQVTLTYKGSHLIGFEPK